MNIIDLKESISQMNRERALELVLKRRKSRLIYKGKKKKKKKKQTEMNFSDTIKASNKEQLKKLEEKIKELQKGES